MSLLDDLQTAVTSQVDAYDDPPDYLTVDTDGDDLVVTGSWREMVEASFGLTAEPDDPIMLPDRDKHDVVLTGSLAQRVRAAFARFHDTVAAPEASLGDPTLIQLAAETGPFSETFVSRFNTNLAFFSPVRGQTTGWPPHSVCESLCATLRELDPDVTSDQLQEVTCVYSDVKESHLMNVQGELTTPHPQRYYDVDSLAAYNDVADDYADLDADGPPYTVRYMARREDGDLATDVIDFAESRIQTVGNNALETDYDYMLEAERLAYLDDDVEEFTVYLYVPVE